jgi:chaperone modulatory protein CbpM
MSESRYRIQEVIRETGVSQERIVSYIQESWVAPIKPPVEKDLSVQELVFDEEDLARIRLIQDLERDFELNENALDVVLHLLDQIHVLRKELAKKSSR